MNNDKYIYCVYLLINTNNNKTYIGITNNINRRIRYIRCNEKLK